MKTDGANLTFELFPDRQRGAFRKVPAATEELYVAMLQPEEKAEFGNLGARLKRLRKLTLMYGDVEDVDFLESFGSIRILKCLLASLRNHNGIGYCPRLTDLILGGSTSSAGNLSFLQHLSHLERLRLEGPHPSMGSDEISPLESLKDLILYAPKWSLSLLPKVFPKVSRLSILQGAYQTLDFIVALKRLETVEIAYARKLTALEAIGSHTHLKNVKLGYAITSLRSCAQLGRSNTIWKLAITSCKNLKDVGVLRNWPALREVEFMQCPNVPAAQIESLRRAGKKVNGN